MAIKKKDRERKTRSLLKNTVFCIASFKMLHNDYSNAAVRARIGYENGALAASAAFVSDSAFETPKTASFALECGSPALVYVDVEVGSDNIGKITLCVRDEAAVEAASALKALLSAKASELAEGACGSIIVDAVFEDILGDGQYIE